MSCSLGAPLEYSGYETLVRWIDLWPRHVITFYDFVVEGLSFWIRFRRYIELALWLSYIAPVACCHSASN